MKVGVWALVLLVGCAPAAPPEDPGETDRLEADADVHDWLIVPGERIGPVGETSSESELLDRVGSERLVRREVYLAEGFCTDGSVLYPDTPDALDIAWIDSTRTRPAFVRFGGKASRWATPAGVHIGTTLAELEAISGEVLTFSGFGWDYGGGTSWHESDQPRGAGLRLSPDSASQETSRDDGAWAEIVGDRPVRSDHPLVRRLTILVEMISIGFGAPFEEHDCRTLAP